MSTEPTIASPAHEALAQVPEVAILSVDEVQVESAERHTPGPDHADECWVCGRGLTEKALERCVWVHVVGAGSYLAAVGLGEVEPAEDLGWFPVGSGCARLIPAGFKGPIQ